MKIRRGPNEFLVVLARWAARYLGGDSAISTPTRRISLEYPIDRYAMEAKRQLDVLDQNLSARLLSLRR